MEIEIFKLFDNLVSIELQNKLSLNKKEMKRRIFLLKKETLNSSETRELEILNIRCFLITSEEIKKYKNENNKN